MGLHFHYQDDDVRASMPRNEKYEVARHYMHTHETAELYYFIAGKTVFHIEGTEYIPERGDILFIRPAEAHYTAVDNNYPYERAVINFDIDIFDSIDPDRTLLRPLFERKAGKLNLYKNFRFKDEIHKVCIENMMTPGLNDRMNVLSNLFLLLNEISKVFSDTAANQDESESLEYKIIRYVNKHISEKLTLNDICDKFYISKPQLCRIFKKATGTTMGQYVTVKRLVMARRLINDGAKPTAVYAECGFGDYSTFYRAYIKNFGEAPSTRHPSNK